MAPPGKWRGYDALRPESFGELDDREAELVVRELVVHELTERHSLGWKVEGPPPPNVGGTDLRVTLAGAPRVDGEKYGTKHHADPLTFDNVGLPVVYSVKSGATGKKHALDEAKNGSNWAVEALERGGRLVVVLMRPKVDAPAAGRKRGANKQSKTPPAQPMSSASGESFSAKLKAAYLERLRSKNPIAADPCDRIHVVDCNDLWTYLRGVRPAISREFLEKLGVMWIPGLLDLTGWEMDHQQDRPPAPGFVWDDARRACAEQLVAALEAERASSRPLWLVSPPGVGKTRLVVEALRPRGGLHARVFAATNPSDAVTAMRDHDLIERIRNAVLVVDDCSETDVFELSRLFSQKNWDGAASLLMITPMALTAVSSQVPQDISRLELVPMDQASSCNLIAEEGGFDPSDEDVRTVASLTEGYPWFSVLVTRELKKDPDKPAPRTVADAVDLALSPRSQTFKRDVERRGAALMVVMLTDGENLDAIGDEDRQAFASLFECFAGWPDVREAIGECADRGLLRPGQGGIFRYVTPAILELEIARRFLAPTPGPGAPRRLDAHLQGERMRGRYTRLLTRLERLGFAESGLADLALPIATRLERAGTVGLAAVESISEGELLFAAKHLPARTAALLDRGIQATPIEELRAVRGLRRPLMFALQALASRRGTFQSAERALFRLARAENEQYANNATNVWAELFDIELNQTYETLADRLRLLEQRLASDGADAQLVALNAISRMLSTHAFKLAADARDGPYPEPTVAEAQNARIWAWTLLSRVMETSDERVVAKAVDIAAKELRGAARSGPLGAAASRLAVSLARVAEPGLRRLRETIDLAERHDRTFIDAQGASEAWATFREALKPRTFRDRLHYRVGAFGPATSRDDMRPDLELAEEAVRSPELLIAELDWLTSPDAVRSVPFAIALGEVDEQQVFLESALARASGSPDFFSGYVRGQANAKRIDVADSLIAKAREEPGMVDAAATAIWRARASPKRHQWLRDDLRAHRVSDRAIAMYGFGAWYRDLRPDQMEEFANALLEAGTDVASTIAVDALVYAVEHADEALRARYVPLLSEAFERASQSPPSGHFAYVWQLAAKILLARGYTTLVGRIAVATAVDGRPGLPRPEALEVLSETARLSAGAVWNALCPALKRDDVQTRSLADAVRESGVLARVPTDVVLDWIGTDAHRATTVARMVSMHQGAALPTVARELIVRFGPDGAVARILAADLHTTPHAVSSLSQFTSNVMTRIEPWTTDSDADVSRFAATVSKELGWMRDQHLAREENERRRHGT